MRVGYVTHVMSRMQLTKCELQKITDGETNIDLSEDRHTITYDDGGIFLESIVATHTGRENVHRAMAEVELRTEENNLAYGRESFSAFTDTRCQLIPDDDMLRYKHRISHDGKHYDVGQ
ncbi:hypothetical protein GR28A_00155 [Vibrio phage vB_VcorM_GR28A]|nr:hypothetical protein GR28A_00155 [Vibrio phage vB_VcorM_GR28A]